MRRETMVIVCDTTNSVAVHYEKKSFESSSVLLCYSGSTVLTLRWVLHTPKDSNFLSPWPDKCPTFEISSIIIGECWTCVSFNRQVLQVHTFLCQLIGGERKSMRRNTKKSFELHFDRSTGARVDRPLRFFTAKGERRRMRQRDRTI